MRVLLVVYDNDSYIHCFPIGLAYIAAVLRENGHDVSVYGQDQFHYPDEHLTDYLDKNEFDIIGVGVIGGYYQYRKLLKISEAVNRSKKRPFYVIGGHGPSPEPDYFIKKTGADAIVIGEGELTAIDLLDALSRRRSLSTVDGIAFRDGDRTIVNKRRPVIKDVDSIPFPAYDLFPIDYYKLIREPHSNNRDFAMSIISSRGCPFKCTFCYRMDPGFRFRSNENIGAEMELLMEKYGINYFSFLDELTMSSEERAIGLSEYFIKKKYRIKWTCTGRLNYAKPRVLQAMKRAGCVFIYYGIEAMDNEVLRKMKKGITTEMVINGIEATLKAGISPGLNVIFGNLGDDRKTLKKGVEFLLKYDDGTQLRTIRPVTPYPGSELYYHAIVKGLLKGCEDFYEKKHVNSDLLSVNFTDMSDDEFHRSLLEANTVLIRNYFKNKENDMIKTSKKLYLERNAGFRGYRQT